MDEDLKGSVDFDFFNDSDDAAEIGETSARVAGKPPLPDRNSPVKFDRFENRLHTKSLETNEHCIEDKCDSDSSDDYISDFESKSDSEDFSDDDDIANLRKVAETNNDSRINFKSKSIVAQKDSQLKEEDDDNSECSSSAYSVSDSDSSSELHRHSENKREIVKTKYRPSNSHTDKDSVELHGDVKKNGWISDNHTSASDTFNNSSNLISERTEHALNKSGRPKKSDKKIDVNKCLKHKNNQAYTEDREHGISNSGSESGSYSDIEGEITDVSPLASPANTPRSKKKNKHFAVIDARTIGHHTSRQGYDNGDKRVEFPAQGSMEFNLLMKAVQELDKDKAQRLKASRRVMFAPPSHSGTSRQSWSSHHPVQQHIENTFSREQARLIERENQRLLKTLLNKRSQGTNHRTRQPPGSAVSPAVKHGVWHSATNRQKQQRLIDLQNMELLKRLQHIQPSKGLSRDEQLFDFQTKTLYGSPIYKELVSAEKTQRTASPYGDTDVSLLSMSSIESVSQPVTHRSVSSRQSSRSASRPSSARRVTGDYRPAWDSRW